jgi:hypothetical protein
MPWLELLRGQEFRVFVCDQKVTCISQQNLFSRNELLCALPSEEARLKRMREWCYALLGAFQDTISDKLAPLRDYSIDATILSDGSVYFNECNGFGAAYAAGSSLFHWTIDHEQLHGMSAGVVHARFVY